VNQNATASNNQVAGGSAGLIGAVTIPNGVTLNDTYFAAFSLAQGPPVFDPATCEHPVNGALPLNACNGQPRMRPTTQVLPTIDAWNLTVQRQLTNTMSLELSYVGNKATHTFAGNGPAYDVNQVAYGPGTAIVTTAGVAPSFTATQSADQRRPFFNKFSFVDSTGATVLCCGSGTMGNYFGNDSSSNYNALQVKLEKRFTQGFQFMTNFTWSKAMNHSPDNGFLYSVAPQSTYGPDDMNRDKVWIFNTTYELPFGKGKFLPAMQVVLWIW